MAKFSKIIWESNENLLINKFIKKFNENLSKRLRKSKRFSFVLTGGKSPIKLYKRLAKLKDIPWNKVDFFITDERYVKKTSKHSNINMCKKNLLNKINISNNQIYNISTKFKSLKINSIKYEKKIKNYFLNKKIKFDMTLLGIGNDGHIASLFKNNINKKTTKIVDYIKKKNFSRITLTINCLNNSKSIYLWAPGKEKSLIIKKIFNDNKFLFPASYLKKKNSFLFYCN